MTNTNTTRAGSKSDASAPGRYKVLTLQLNVTVYPSAGTLRYVINVREPLEHIDLRKDVGGTSPVTRGLVNLGDDYSLALGHMLYLAGFDERSRQPLESSPLDYGVQQQLPG